MKDTTAAGINRSVKFLFRGLNSKRATSTTLCPFLCIGFTKIKTILRKLRMHNHRQNNLATTGRNMMLCPRRRSVARFSVASRTFSHKSFPAASR